jgi:glycosyltransferase involved in cell wall biosynthesis
MLSFVIVTPSYNQADFLGANLESIKMQNVPLTHIVIDAKSQDNSLEILSNFSSGSLQYSFQYISEKDKGQSSAINKGWALAQGEVYSWLNSDDILCPNALKIVNEAFVNFPDADFIYGNCNYIDEKGNFLGSYPVETYNYEKLVSEAKSYIPQPACFIKSKTLKEVGGLREDLHYVMDLDLWLRLGAIGKGLYINETLACLRIHDKAKSVKSLNNFGHELLLVYEDFFRDYKNILEIQALEKLAMQHVFTRAADIAFWSANYRQSLHYALRAFRIRPINNNWLLWRLLVFSFLAKFHLLPARFTHHNHYLMRG